MLRSGLFILGVAGVSAQTSYQTVDSGHCEDQGYESLASAAECEAAAQAEGVGFGGPISSLSTDGGCYLHPDGKYYFNTNTNNFECSNTNEYLPCVCLVPPATECTNPSSAAAYIDAQCCDCP